MTPGLLGKIKEGEATQQTTVTKEADLTEFQKYNQQALASNVVVKNFSEDSLIKLAKSTTSSEVSAIVLNESLNLFNNKFKMNKLGMADMTFEQFYKQNTALVTSVLEFNKEVASVKDEGLRKALYAIGQEAAKNSKTSDEFLKNLKEEGEKEGGNIKKTLKGIINNVAKSVNQKMEEIAYKFSSAAIAANFIFNNFTMQKNSIQEEMERIRKSKESEEKKEEKIEILAKDLENVKKLEDNVKELKNKLGDALVDNLVIKRNLKDLDKLMKENELDLKNAITAQSYDKTGAFAKGLAEIVDKYSKMDHNWDKLTPKKTKFA